MWKGTEVAVKVMATKDVNKDAERGFRDEVRVMTALRHPNVVLFMAACTKPPRMCIVMELMSLGSLYDVRPFSVQCTLINNLTGVSLCNSCFTTNWCPTSHSRSRAR